METEGVWKAGYGLNPREPIIAALFHKPFRCGAYKPACECGPEASFKLGIAQGLSPLPRGWRAREGKLSFSRQKKSVLDASLDVIERSEAAFDIVLANFSTVRVLSSGTENNIAKGAATGG